LTTTTSSLVKNPDQKTTTPLKATFYKAYSQIHPRYSQPAPQQTGTSQNCGNSHLQRLYVALWQLGEFVFHNSTEGHRLTCGSWLASDEDVTPGIIVE
jgi:hypothetical protein